MPKAVLFDLDGTLIDDSMDTFLPPYFAALTKKLAHLVPPHTLIEHLYASTRAMVANTDSSRTLAQVFEADFFSRLGIPRETLMPLFEDFYAREYRDLRAYVRAIPQARTVVQRAFESGARVVIATMPVFPLVAVRQRLEWGKLDDFDYALVTAYENMSTSKPNPAYYREIAVKIGCEPSECLMIGNEVQNDILPAKHIGMKTFWVTNTVAMSGDASADWRGTLDDLDKLLAHY